MSDFIEPTTRFGRLRQFLWFHWHRLLVAVIFAAVCWAAVHFAPDKNPPFLLATMSAQSIAHAMRQYARLPPASDDSPVYPPAGFDTIASLVNSGILKRAEIFTDRAPPGEPAFFYFPPPVLPYDPSSTPMIIENPRPVSSGPMVTVVYYDLSPTWLQGDELWNLLDGRKASDGTVFNRPPN